MHLDDDLLNAMRDECSLVGDSSIEQTIQRRLAEGIPLAVLTGRDQLLWRPVRTDARGIQIRVPTLIADDLIFLSELFGYQPDVMACTILFNDACRPRAVLRAVADRQYEPIRHERGRGKIYSVNFELAGYQLIFLKLLSGNAASRSAVLGEALLALAREVQVTGLLSDKPISEEAFAFARQMVGIPAWRPIS